MTPHALHLDPELYRTFDEPPYRARRECVYAPVEPFAVAIDDWLRRYQASIGATQFAGISLRRPPSPSAHGTRTTRLRDRGIGEIAELTGIPNRTIRRYVNREQAYIAVENADKIAMALGIPLILLAEDFRTLPRWRT
jgi:transcriptional regulator with XRE-family HTH domain